MPIYDRIEANRRRTAALMAIFLILIVALGWVVGALTGLGPVATGAALVIALVANWWAWYHSDRLALVMVHARPADPKRHVYLINTVEGLAIAAGLPPPKVYVIDDTAINAFAAGRDPQHAVLAVTQGAIDRLKRLELEGVIAHEMSHIKNRDTLVMTAVIALVGTIIFTVDIAWHMLRYRGERGHGNVIILVVGLVLILLAPLLAQLLKFAVSRRREFLADADAALLTRYPPGLADALERIAQDKEELEVANEATAHLFIANPFKRSDWMERLFSTHPPLAERIKALRAM